MLRKSIIISSNLEELLRDYGQDSSCSLIIYCLQGRLQIEANNNQYVVSEHDLLLCEPEAIIGKYLYSPDLKCHYIAIKRHALDDIIYLCMRDDDKWWEKSQYLQQHPVLHLNERQQELASLFERIFALYTDEEQPDLHDKIRRIFAQAAVYELLSWIEKTMDTDTGTEEPRRMGRQDVQFRRFAHLLNETRGRQREVQWFANEMAITPKYLTSICHTVCGRSALSLINDTTVREMKRLLTQTDMSTKEICVEMNFSSLSFFCKFAKQHLGMPANDYRTAYAQGKIKK